jgi:hypothetical protein
MGGGHQVDIMATQVLKFQHKARQLLKINISSLPFLAEFVILAIAAYHVAVREKYRA